MSIIPLSPATWTIKLLRTWEYDIKKVTPGHINSDVLLRCFGQWPFCMGPHTSKVRDIHQTPLT